MKINERWNYNNTYDTLSNTSESSDSPSCTDQPLFILGEISILTQFVQDSIEYYTSTVTSNHDRYITGKFSRLESPVRSL